MGASFLLVVPVFLALSTPGHTCECKLQHPQTVYCSSDVVVLADILRLENKTQKKQAFRIKVLKAFKLPVNVSDVTLIYSPLESTKCGYELKTSPQRQLLIAGNKRAQKISFTRCHLVYPWNKLTKEQKAGFKSEYRKGCSCNIQPCVLCSRDCQQPGNDECVWKQTNCNYAIWKEEQSQRSACFPSRSGSCKWTRVQGKP